MVGIDGPIKVAARELARLRAPLKTDGAAPCHAHTRKHTYICGMYIVLEDDWPESIFPLSSLPAAETPFTSMRRACLRAAMLDVYGHMRAPSHRPTRGNMAVSGQAALFQAAARKLLSASCCTQVARHLSSSCSAHVVQVSLRKTLGACICAQDAQPEPSCGGAPRTIRLRFRVAIFRSARSTLHILRLLCLSRSCLEPGRNRTRDRAIAKAGAQTTRLNRIRTAPQRARVDTHDPRRGFIRAPQKRKKKQRVFAPRTRRSPQRAARAPQESQKTSSFYTSTTPIPTEGCAGRQKSQKTSSFCTSTTPIPAEGRAGRSEIAKNLQFLHLDRRSPQRVANPIDDQSPVPAP